MAENPRFNNSNMFNNSNDYSDITPNSTSEVLATQGNVINSIKVFWNKLRAKLAYAVTRPQYDNAVGGNYQPVYIDKNGVVQVCAPETIHASIEGSNINIGNIPIHPGKTICIQLNGSLIASATPLKIGSDPIIYPSGASVYPTDVHTEGTYLLTYMYGGGAKWILISSMNVADDTNPGLMTADEHKKLANIADNANNFTYTLPTANASNIGGVKSKATGITANRNYDVEVNSDGTMKVNVPWQNTHNTARISVVSDTNGHPIIRLNDGGNTTDIPIVPMLGAQAYIGAEGQIVLAAPNAVSYNTLKTDTWNNNYEESIPYTVFGPGKDKATTDYFLSGNGSWQMGTSGRWMELDSDTDLTYASAKQVIFGDLYIKGSGGSKINFTLVDTNGIGYSSTNYKLTIDSKWNITINKYYPILSLAEDKKIRPGFIKFTYVTNNVTVTIY